MLRCAALLTAIVAGNACSHKEHPAGLGGGTQSQVGVPDVDPCAAPGHQGCPCGDAGAAVECGKVVKVEGDYITCSMGYSHCDGMSWGGCEGNRIVTISASDAGPGAHSLSTTKTCTNICDPNCTSVVGEPKDVTAPGATISDGGVSITPTNGTGGGGGPCKGLWCQVQACAGLSKTSLSGTVYDPAGKVPLYNASVYIPVDPTAALPAFTSGVSCDTCAGAGNLSAIAVAQTGPDGKFSLKNVPSGVGIPLVVQMGKWRRKITLPAVTACTDNPVAKDNSHLPRTRFDGDSSQADIPKMAIASGSADPFECLLLKAGIDPSEIQFPGTAARIDYYRFNGNDRYPGGAPAGTTLSSNPAKLNQYDVVLLPCEGHEDDSNGTDTPNLVKYTAAGGRMFTTHYGYSWLATPNSGVAQDNSEYYRTANWDLDRGRYHDPTAATVDQTFPKGKDFAQWLKNVGASSSLGAMTINEPREDAQSATSSSQRWLYGRSSLVKSTDPPDMLLSMTFNTPVDAPPAQQCGRVVYSDFHVSASALVSGSGACTTDTDCGFGATCGKPTLGTCSPDTCATDSDCSGSAKCVGETTGLCKPQACSPSVSCSKGTCGKVVAGQCACTKNSHCSSGASCNTTTGLCDKTTCTSESDCGKAEDCIGGSSGVCKLACTTNKDCSNGGLATTCASGFCQTCTSDNDCPGSSTTCVGANASGCSASSSQFPLACRNGDLSGQEKALEFMLFDLTACVSPDSYVPSGPTIQYNPLTFTQDFSATCATGFFPIWREFDWQAAVPPSASINLSLQTAADTSSFATAPAVNLATATSSTPLPAWDVGLIDTGAGGAFRSVSPRLVSKSILRVTITLNPTSDLKSSPTLNAWRALYDCADSE